MIVRSRGLPALETPWSRWTDPLCHGVGASPALAATCFRLLNVRNRPSAQSVAAASGPMPLSASNRAAGAGTPGLACARASQASRSASTALTCSIRSSSRSSSRLIWAFRQSGSGRPSPVISSSSPLPTVAVQGLVVADPLGEQKPLDAIDVLDPFGCQGLALTTDPAPILLLWGRGLDPRTNPGLATLVGQQCANQGFAVDRVGLRPPTPTGRRD